MMSRHFKALWVFNVQMGLQEGVNALKEAQFSGHSLKLN